MQAGGRRIQGVCVVYLLCRSWHHNIIILVSEDTSGEPGWAGERCGPCIVGVMFDRAGVLAERSGEFNPSLSDEALCRLRAGSVSVFYV